MSFMLDGFFRHFRESNLNFNFPIASMSRYGDIFSFTNKLNFMIVTFA